jgi:hypothetical protein
MHSSNETRPVLDIAALDELRACDEDGRGELLGELIDIYLSDTPKRLVVLRMAFDAGAAHPPEPHRAIPRAPGSSGTVRGLCSAAP